MRAASTGRARGGRTAVRPARATTTALGLTPPRAPLCPRRLASPPQHHILMDPSPPRPPSLFHAAAGERGQHDYPEAEPYPEPDRDGYPKHEPEPYGKRPEPRPRCDEGYTYSEDKHECIKVGGLTSDRLAGRVCACCGHLAARRCAHAPGAAGAEPPLCAAAAAGPSPLLEPALQLLLMRPAAGLRPLPRPGPSCHPHRLPTCSPSGVPPAAAPSLPPRSPPAPPPGLAPPPPPLPAQHAVLDSQACLCVQAGEQATGHASLQMHAPALAGMLQLLVSAATPPPVRLRPLTRLLPSNAPRR